MKFLVEGTDGSGRPWRHHGSLRGSGGMVAAAKLAVEKSYLALTDGETEYGKPGEGKCKGPYKITKMVLED